MNNDIPTSFQDMPSSFPEIDDAKIWIKKRTIQGVCYPQHPSFCGIAACAGVINALLGSSVTKEELHEAYGVGARTKLPLSPNSELKNLGQMNRKGMGFSNWDLIRLVNAACLDRGIRPWSSVLCGQSFFREMTQEENQQRFLTWVQEESHQAIIHISNHYVVLAGLHIVNGSEEIHFIQADSARNKGPLSSSSLGMLQDLAKRDYRYGFVLFSLEPIPRSLFTVWSDDMYPKESQELHRFERIERFSSSSTLPADLAQK